VSRSGGDDKHLREKPTPEGGGLSVSASRPGSHGEDDGAEVTVHLKVGYKTVLLVVVIFDFIHLSFREITNASWFEQLLGLGQ